MSSGQLSGIVSNGGLFEHKYLSSVYELIEGTKSNCVNFPFTNHQLILDTVNFIDFTEFSGVAKRGLVDKLRELKVTAVNSPKNGAGSIAKRDFENKIESVVKVILKGEMQTLPKGVVDGKIEILTAVELMDELNLILTKLRDQKPDFIYYNLVLDVVAQERLIEIFHWGIFVKKLETILSQSREIYPKDRDAHQRFNARLGRMIAHFQTEMSYIFALRTYH